MESVAGARQNTEPELEAAGLIAIALEDRHNAASAHWVMTGAEKAMHRHCEHNGHRDEPNDIHARDITCATHLPHEIQLARSHLSAHMQHIRTIIDIRAGDRLRPVSHQRTMCTSMET